MFRSTLQPPAAARSPVTALLQRKCACGTYAMGGECEACRNHEQETLQRFLAGSKARNEGETAPPLVHDVLRSNGQPLDPATRTSLDARFGYDFSQVRVHSDEKAAESAQAVNAAAFTVGRHVVFGSGQFAPFTAHGQRLLAHELTHVVQQRGADVADGNLTIGPADDAREREAEQSHDRIDAAQWTGGGESALIQRRRLPSGAGLSGTLPAGGAGFSEHRSGLVRAIRRAWAALTAAQKTTVRTNAAAFGITGGTDAALFAALSAADRTKLLSFANEMRAVAPGLVLGDPALIKSGPRPATSDAANITTLVTNANKVFDDIAAGTHDSDLTDVFGAAHVTTAKVKYANARLTMNTLHTTAKIVTDRSGFSAEVGLGGLSNSSQIAVEPSVIDHPGNDESVVTLIHESMHAGNADVGDDGGYIANTAAWKGVAAAVKLTNAAHFEIVPRRNLSASNAFVGVTFIPAGTTVSGVSAPALTSTERAIADATETFKGAWTVGLNLHTQFVRVFRNRSEWDTLDVGARFTGAQAGARWSNTLPFWSKVENLTIHERSATINAAAATADTAPVTLIDIALSEGLIRKLNQGQNAVPTTPAAARTFERAHLSTSQATTARASAASEARVLKRLVLRHVTGSITGTVDRDAEVVERMALTHRGSAFAEYFKIRSPGAFPF